MKLYDISQELFSCSVYPGDPCPEFERVSKISDGKLYNLTTLKMCAHNGTHLDAPKHFIDEGKSVDQLDLSKCYGRATVVECNDRITAQRAYEILDSCEKRLLIKGCAVVTLEAAQVFKEGGLVLIGTESQTVGPEDAPMDVHLELLGAEVILLEGLRLQEVEEGEYVLCAFPINLGGADGSPVRAVLIDEKQC